MQRYHDVISSFGGKTSYDADNRPLLVMRSNLWASGYDVDGTDQTSLGQFSGRVQQTYKHSVPRFFVPEHGTMFTLALVRFPPTATKEIQYLNETDALDEEKWLNMLGTFVKDWFRYESHFVHGRDSLVDILKERGLLSESDAVQP